MDTACIEWQGTRDRYGYGVSGSHKNRRKAHRVAWEEVNGPIPRGRIVCHHCDNPPCVNVDHLYLGTHQTNAADRSERNPEWRARASDNLRKNRRHNLPGEGSTTHKLTREQVEEIRRVYKPNPGRNASPVSQAALAKRYGVTQTTISRALRGDRWGEGSGVTAPTIQWHR